MVLAFLAMFCQGMMAQITVISNYPELKAALNDTAVTVITNFLTNSIITLETSGEQLTINRQVLIDGGTNGVVIDGNGENRLFNIGANGSVILNNLQLINGLSTNGGAIFNRGTLIISNCIIAGNAATNRSGAQGETNVDNGNGSSGTSGGTAAGGAIYSTGPLSIYFSIVGTNSALGGSGGSGGGGEDGVVFGGNGGNAGGGGSAFGAAIYTSGSSNVFVSSQFFANVCTAGAAGSGGTPGSGAFPGDGGAGASGGSALGGAVYVTGSGSLSVTNCLFAQNTITAGASGSDGTPSDNGFSGGVAEGGGVYIIGTVTNVYFENSTFYQNSCTGGAGGSTTSGNDGGNGGTAVGGGLASGARLTILRNCTLATNTLVAGVGGSGTVKDGSGGSTGGWDIYRVGGEVELSDSIISGGTNESPNLKPNVLGVTDGGYNLSSDSSLARAAGDTTLIDVNGTNIDLDSGLGGNGGPNLGPGGLIDPPDFLSLAIVDGSIATNFIPGVPGLSFPATDELGNPRRTPTSAGAFELNVLTINSNAAPPTISLDISSNIITSIGDTVTISATAINNDSTNNLGYQWQLNGTNLTDNATFMGTTSSNLTIEHVQLADQGNYQVIASVSLLENAVTSSVLSVLVINSTKITVQPVSKSRVPDGSVITFSVTATGTPPLAYQWYQVTADGSTNTLSDGGNISGSVTNALTIDGATTNDEGSYFVVVSGIYGTVTSVKASLTLSGPDVSKPTIIFSSPLAGTRTTNGVVAGTATDSAQVTNVLYWITNMNARGDPPKTIKSGVASFGVNGTTTKTWAISNVFLPGTNYITVQSVNYGGHLSTLETREFFYEVPTNLTFRAEGGGTVTGGATVAGGASLTNETLLNIGQSYTLTAIPVKNNIFSRWIGSFPGTVSDTPTLHFIMEPGMKLRALFTTNYFIGASGTYNGLFYGTNGVTEQTAGLLKNLRIASTGAYSGTMMLGGVSYSLISSFNSAGYASNIVKRTAKQGGSVAVEMNLNWTNGQINGSVSSLDSEEAWDSPLEAEKSAISSRSAEYTVLLSPGTNFTTGEIPPGFGYLLITNHNGAVTLSGALADGTALNEAPPLGVLGDIPVYANLYANGGLLLGWLGLSNATVEAESALAWIKPAARTGLYAEGFTNYLLVSGSGWTNPPAKEFAIPLVDGSLLITNTSLDLNFTVSITNDTLVKSSNAPTNSLTGTVAPKTGLLTITFGNGVGRATTIGHGVILQNSTNGGGYFVTTTNSGAVILTP